MSLPQHVEIGQHWAAWVPSRRQWLLTTVVRLADGRATLRYDARYEVGARQDELCADEDTMLAATNLFRLLEDD